MANLSETETWLSRVVPERCLSGAYALCGDWASQIDGCGQPGMYVLTRGQIWLGGPADCSVSAKQLAAGDIVLMPRVEPHGLASQPTLRPRPVAEVWGEGRDVDGFWQIGEGERAEVHTVRLRGGPLPPLPVRSTSIIARSKQSKSVRSVVEALCHELQPGVGSALVAQALVHALWLRVLSNELQGFTPDLRLFALVEQVSQNVEAVRSVEDMARLCGLSRSRFTERFSACYGVSPLLWLSRLRMAHAERLVTKEGLSVAAVAERLGYGSESSFRKAFRRVMGLSARAGR